MIGGYYDVKFTNNPHTIPFTYRSATFHHLDAGDRVVVEIRSGSGIGYGIGVIVGTTTSEACKKHGYTSLIVDKIDIKEINQTIEDAKIMFEKIDKPISVLKNL